jgi:hypothetical protein
VNQKFALPGAEPLARFMADWLDGTLEAVKQPSPDGRLQQWKVLYEDREIGRYTLVPAQPGGTSYRSWFGRIPGLRSASTIACIKAITPPGAPSPVPEDQHNVVWEDHEGEGVVFPLNPVTS